MKNPAESNTFEKNFEEITGKLMELERIQVLRDVKHVHSLEWKKFRLFIVDRRLNTIRGILVCNRRTYSKEVVYKTSEKLVVTPRGHDLKTWDQNNPERAKVYSALWDAVRALQVGVVRVEGKAEPVAPIADWM